jgi:hypothetical protein
VLVGEVGSHAVEVCRAAGDQRWRHYGSRGR